MTTFSKKEAINFGWEKVKSNILYFAGITLVIIAAPYVVQWVLDAMFATFYIALSLPRDTLYLASLPGGIASAIVSLVLSIGMVRFLLHVVDGKTAKASDLYDTSRKEVLRYLLGSIIYTLITLVGFLLLFVPGIIFSIKYSFYNFFIIDKGLPATDAIRASGEITKGNKWNLLLFGLLLGLINILGVVALILGLFITIPLTWIANAYIYRKLSTGYTYTPSKERLA